MTTSQMRRREEAGCVFDFSTSDFATVVKTSAFVDKTLMLRDIFNSSSHLLITAPPRFGKSTNIDMVRRFLEINVDSSGTRKPVHTTENYKLFKENNLDICRHDEFFNKHFGNYPVINTDWKALSRASDFCSMIDIFRTIIFETFSLHNYLLYVDRLWINVLDINEFKRYLSCLLYTSRDVFLMDSSCLAICIKAPARSLSKTPGKNQYNNVKQPSCD